MGAKRNVSNGAFSMIKRDKAGIIVQHSLDNPFYADGGDSAPRTGPMAAAGSTIDLANLAYFISRDHRIVRHPGQAEWNNPAKTSRDNVVQFMVADHDCQRLAALYYARDGRVNADWLSPSVRLYLYKVARVKPPLLIFLLGYLNLAIDLVWNCKVKPDDEINQFICMCAVMGQRWAKMLIKYHPSLEQNLVDYWGDEKGNGGWRDQPELKNALLKIVTEKAGV